MDMARAILEGIHEVELQVTPEFQKEWPVPKLWDKVFVAPDQAGNPRARVVYSWSDGTIATGLEVQKSEGYELNVWAPGSTIKPGNWASAMSSIRKKYGYQGGVYVYIQSAEDPLFREVEQIPYETIDDKEPGDEPVVDHFLGYEAVPASKQPKGATGTIEPVGPTGPTWGVPLEQNTKLVLVNRPWVHVTHPNADVTESNPVIVLTKHLPIQGFIDKKKTVEVAFEELEFLTLWSPKLEAWRIWPDEDQTPEEFDEQLMALIQHIDEVIDAAEET